MVRIPGGRRRAQSSADRAHAPRAARKTRSWDRTISSRRGRRRRPPNARRAQKGRWATAPGESTRVPAPSERHRRARPRAMRTPGPACGSRFAEDRPEEKTDVMATTTETVLERLRSAIPPARIRAAAETLKTNSHDDAEWAPYEPPLAVVFAETTEDVAAAVRVAGDNGL